MRNRRNGFIMLGLFIVVIVGTIVIEMRGTETWTELDLHSGRLRDKHRAFGARSMEAREHGWKRAPFKAVYGDKAEAKWFCVLHTKNGIIPSRQGEISARKRWYIRHCLAIRPRTK